MAPTTGSDGCIVWPDPDLARFPCGNAITGDRLERWEAVATGMMFAEAGQRFPGIECEAKIRVRGLYGCGGSFTEADLAQAIPYPIREILSVEISGNPDDGLLANFWIRGQRWLTVDEGASFPDDNSRVRPGGSGSAVFTVCYGREAPPDLVAARDELIWTLVMSQDPPTSHQSVRVVEGVTTLTENGRTITIEPDQMGSGLLEWARKAYPRKRIHKSRIFDLAEDRYTATVELVHEEE